MVRTISILGSTGSIGVNALEVIFNLKKSFKVKYLSTNKNVDLLIDKGQFNNYADKKESLVVSEMYKFGM